MPKSKKSFGAELAEELCDAFSEQIDKRGYKKLRAIEGALKAFMAMPKDLQVTLMSANEHNVHDLLVAGLLDAEIQVHLDKLGPAKKEFVALLKQAKGKASPKK